MKIDLLFKIGEIRIQKNISVRQLSLLSGVSKTHISEIERGNRIPTIEVLCRIAEGLMVRPEDLYEYNVLK